MFSRPLLILLLVWLSSRLAPPGTQARPRQRCFEPGGICVSDPILAYWERNGGLSIFGYPITERQSESIEGRVYEVQYFERRRMEYHPELAGTPYAILLGLLGQTLAETDSCVALDPGFEPTAYAYRDLLGCPIYASRELVGNKRLGGLRDVPLAIQRFERGTLLWFQPLGLGTASLGNIVVIGFDASRQALTWQQYQDTWREGEATGVVEQPPPGLYAPAHGFGKLWSAHPDVRQLLGWATEPEHGEMGGYRAFRKGFVIYRAATDRCYLFTDDGIAREVPRV